MALVESKRQKMLRIKQQRGQRRKEKQDKQIQLAKQMMEQKLMRKMEQQGIQLQLGTIQTFLYFDHILYIARYIISFTQF